MPAGRVIVFPRGNPSIAEVLTKFLEAQRERLGSRTWKRYEGLFSTWQEYLDHYGTRHLSRLEKAFWKRYCRRTKYARFTEVFGPELLLRSAPEFFGEYAMEELMDPYVLECAGTIVRKLAKWLSEKKLIDPREAAVLWHIGTKVKKEFLPAAAALTALDIRYSNRRPYDKPSWIGKCELVEVLPGRLRFTVRDKNLEVSVPLHVASRCRPGWVFTFRLCWKRSKLALVGAEKVNIFGWQNNP